MYWPQMARFQNPAWLLLCLGSLAAILPGVCRAEAHHPENTRKLSFHSEMVDVQYDTDSGAFDLQWKDGHKIGNIVSQAELTDGTKLSTSTYTSHQLVQEHTKVSAHRSDAQELTFKSTAPNTPSMIQHLWLYPGKSWVTMDVELDGGEKVVATRHFDVMIVSGKDIVAGPSDATLHVLHVPFDNDMWFRWRSIAASEMKAGERYTSQEVTALYDNTSRQAIVVGSVAHDTWKTAIDFSGGQQQLESLDIYGGISSPSGERSDTHDFLPHGIVSGHRVSSPHIFIGSFADWRDGLDAYGHFNAQVRPPLHWNEGKPMGWNSWAAYADKIDDKRYLEAAKFVHDELLPEGFGGNVVYINLDAFWSKLDSVQLSDAVSDIHAMSTKNGTTFRPGIYWTPFAYWSDDLDAYVEGTGMKYRYRDILLKGPDGSPLPKVDGGRPIDPTHPGSLARTEYYISHLQQLGFQYLKLDFLTHGILEGDHYDKSIQTGVQAYNKGMQEVVKANHGKMFLSLSIAPLFPSGYGHARRLSCDTKGHINGEAQSTEYMLNALTYGWWTDGTLFTADPDHVVLGSKADEGARNVTEGKSRLLSAVITGGMILDSSRLADDPEGQALARKVYDAKPYFKVAADGVAFRPIEGNTGDRAADIFIRDTTAGTYVAVFNFSDKDAKTVRIPLDRISSRAMPKKFSGATDVVSSEHYEIRDNGLEVNLAPSKSKLLFMDAGK